MKRFRIDFSIQETGCPPEEAQGIRFGDEVDADKIFDFFNRCRDAALTLFHGGKRPREHAEEEFEQLKKEAERLKRKAMMTGQAQMGVAQRPKQVDDIASFRRMFNGDDGSRGGDGPPVNDPEWRAKNGMRPL